MDKAFEKVWINCLEIIKDIVEWQHFKTWFEPIKPVALKEKVLTIQVPSQFFYEYLEEHYVSLLAKTLKRELGKEARLEYRIMVDSGNSKNKPQTIDVPGQGYKSYSNNEMDFPLVINNPVKNPFVIPGLKKMQIDPQLNHAYTFEAFIEGDCNRVARRAGKTVAEKPGTTSFNPLVIYGGVGLGKTHLAQAIGNEVKRLHTNKVVLYVSSEKFINQFIDHGRNGAINDFIHFYQLIDVLIIDDVQFFAKAEKSQDAFFAIFNHLHQSGKQLVDLGEIEIVQTDEFRAHVVMLDVGHEQAERRVHARRERHEHRGNAEVERHAVAALDHRFVVDVDGVRQADQFHAAVGLDALGLHQRHGRIQSHGGSQRATLHSQRGQHVRDAAPPRPSAVGQATRARG